MAEDEGTGVTGDEEDVYPPDDEDDLDESTGVPQPRGRNVRRAILQAHANKPSKQAKSVKKHGNRILAKERQRKALEMRKLGASYQTIAENMGYHDASGARKAVLKAFSEIIQEPVGELRTIQMERLNQMLLILWNKINAGEEGAINTALRVMAQMDALMGTQAAQQVEVKQTNTAGVLVIDGNKDDFIASLRKMAGVQADGTNAQALPVGHTAEQLSDQPDTPQRVGPNYPPGMSGGDDIVEAELVDDGWSADEQAEGSSGGLVQPATAPTKKKFSFGVDPTVKRG